MYVLDTDVTSNLFDAARSSELLRRRVRSTPLDDLAITVITLEETMRGALDEIRKRDSRRRSVVDPYADIQRLYYNLTRFAMLPYSADAEGIYSAFSPIIKRIGTNDCRIAAIALAGGHVVVTANTRDFSRIPGLLIQDWTSE